MGLSLCYGSRAQKQIKRQATTDADADCCRDRNQGDPIAPYSHFGNDPNGQRDECYGQIPDQSAGRCIDVPRVDHTHQVKAIRPKPLHEIIHRVNRAPDGKGKIYHAQG